MTNRNDIEKLFKSHYRQMHRMAQVILYDDDLARDIVHDVFLSLLSKDSSVSVTAGYLLAAVRNRCLNHIAGTATRQRIANLYLLESDEYDAEVWPDDNTIACIYQIIKNDLTPQCRRVMELRFVDGLTFSNVAKEMDISENAVYKHVRHALVIIRKKLNERNG